MISALVSAISGAWMVKLSRPSTPALVARLAMRSKAAMYSGPAVGVAGVVERVDADEDVAGPSTRPRPGRSDEEDGVAGRDVGDGDAVRPCPSAERSLGTAMSAVRAEPPNGRRSMSATTCAGGAELARRPGGGLEFDRVPLAVAEGEGVGFVAFVPGDGQGGGGIEAAAEQDDGSRRSGECC